MGRAISQSYQTDIVLWLIQLFSIAALGVEIQSGLMLTKIYYPTSSNHAAITHYVRPACPLTYTHNTCINNLNSKFCLHLIFIVNYPCAGRIWQSISPPAMFCQALPAGMLSALPGSLSAAAAAPGSVCRYRPGSPGRWGDHVQNV